MGRLTALACCYCALAHLSKDLLACELVRGHYRCALWAGSPLLMLI